MDMFTIYAATRQARQSLKAIEAACRDGDYAGIEGALECFDDAKCLLEDATGALIPDTWWDAQFAARAVEDGTHLTPPRLTLLRSRAGR
jgi:hypothetical protein